MNEQQKDEGQSVTSDFSLFLDSMDNLILLAKGIPKNCVAEMRKSRALQQQAFTGFRPQTLPPDWDKRLARFAHHQSGKTKWLVDHWFHSQQNVALRCQVVEEVGAERFRQDVIEVLARSGIKQCELLLCALLLDERAEVREAITDEFRGELLDPNSDLLRQAEARWRELEKERESERLLQAAQDEAAAARLQLEDRDVELEELRARADALERVAKQTNDSLSELRRTLGDTEQERDEERRAAEISRQNEGEARGNLRDLQRRNADLQAQLQALETECGRVAELNEARNSLEDLRKKAENRCRHLEREYGRAQRLLEEERKHPRHTVSLAMLDESWREALTSIATHLRAHAVAESGPNQTNRPHRTAPDQSNAPALTGTQRAEDWQSWQQLETHFARHLLQDESCDLNCAPPDELEDCLSQARRAQQLLSVRWYLLEGFRLRLLEALRAANAANDDSGTPDTRGDGP